MSLAALVQEWSLPALPRDQVVKMCMYRLLYRAVYTNLRTRKGSIIVLKEHVQCLNVEKQILMFTIISFDKCVLIHELLGISQQ